MKRQMWMASVMVPVLAAFSCGSEDKPSREEVEAALAAAAPPPTHGTAEEEVARHKADATATIDAIRAIGNAVLGSPPELRAPTTQSAVPLDFVPEGRDKDPDWAAKQVVGEDTKFNTYILEHSAIAKLGQARRATVDPKLWPQESPNHAIELVSRGTMFGAPPREGSGATVAARLSNLLQITHVAVIDVETLSWPYGGGSSFAAGVFEAKVRVYELADKEYLGGFALESGSSQNVRAGGSATDVRNAITSDFRKNVRKALEIELRAFYDSEWRTRK